MSTTSTRTSTEIPGYVAGTWTIDPVHTDVSFSVRHIMVSKVRGRFATFEGEIVTGENPLDSTVNATVDLRSIDTNNEQRDDHIRSSDFFDVETHPAMTFHSTGVSADGDGFIVEGDLSLHGVTRRVPLHLELNGFGKDPYGGTRAGFSARGEINRNDFGVSFNAPVPGGVMISERIQIEIEAEAVLKKD